MIQGMQDHWQAKGMIPMNAVRNVLAQALEGIAYCHLKDVVHRDIKGDNYLMDKKQIEDTTVKIYLSDFGTVVNCKKDEKLKESCGTKVYWSPEVHKHAYGQKVDIWAMG